MIWIWIGSFTLIGVIAGWLAGRMLSGYGFGLIGDVIVGIIGAVAGGLFVFRATGAELGGIGGRLIAAFLGAWFLLFVIRPFTARRRGPRIWSD